jgi:hypothetical protein
MFKTGTYKTRSICDHNCIFSVEVISSTEKTVMFTDGKETKRAKIHHFNGETFFYPYGRYSIDRKSVV